eukprot:2293665-Amphidinium_carterae.1
MVYPEAPFLVGLINVWSDMGPTCNVLTVVVKQCRECRFGFLFFFYCEGLRWDRVCALATPELGGLFCVRQFGPEYRPYAL